MSCGKTKEREHGPSFTTEDIYKGTQGIIVEFIKDTPPDNSIENKFLPIAFKISNKGACYVGVNDAENNLLVPSMAYITIKPIEIKINKGSLTSIKGEDIETLDEKKFRIALEGKSIENPDGDYSIITFTVDSTIDDIVKTKNAQIIVNYCYGYKTRAIATACIDPDPYGIKIKNKPCNIRPIVLDSQGAPIAVTKIETTMVPDQKNKELMKPRFIVYIANKGTGRVVSYSTDEETLERECSTTPNTNEWDKIKIEASLRGKPLKCENNGIITLKDNKGTILCESEVGYSSETQTFSSPLVVTLEYAYKDKTLRSIKITKI